MAPVAPTQTPKIASAVTTANEPLVIVLQNPDAGSVWKLTHISAIGELTVRAPIAVSAGGPGVRPATGLFMCSLQDAQNGIGPENPSMNLNIRSIPLRNCYSHVVMGDGSFRFEILWTAENGPLLVPSTYAIVAIVEPLPGTATPGPGAASFGSLVALSEVLSVAC